MPRIRVVLVGVEHDMNLGSVCRAMKNFGCTELFLVNPVAKMGFQATLFAKHSEDVLKKAKTVKSVAEACEGCELVIGTTGVPDRYADSSLKSCLSPKQLVEKCSALGKGKKIALLFGSESRGLSKEDLQECDLFCSIPTSNLHRVLNLSHAVAVVLYELFSSKKKSKPLYSLADRKQVKTLEALFAEFVSQNRKVRDKKKVSTAFKRILDKGLPSGDEASALMAAFSK
jgi:TrmH family RNA methyltransferase